MTRDPHSHGNPQEGCPKCQTGWCYDEREDAAKMPFPGLGSVTKLADGT